MTENHNRRQRNLTKTAVKIKQSGNPTPGVTAAHRAPGAVRKMESAGLCSRPKPAVEMKLKHEQKCSGESLTEKDHASGEDQKGQAAHGVHETEDTKTKAVIGGDLKNNRDWRDSATAENQTENQDVEQKQKSKQQ
jgi:hypothetical protein